jgi:hypothetical protein
MARHEFALIPLLIEADNGRPHWFPVVTVRRDDESLHRPAGTNAVATHVDSSSDLADAPRQPKNPGGTKAQSSINSIPLPSPRGYSADHNKGIIPNPVTTSVMKANNARLVIIRAVPPTTWAFSGHLGS